MPSIVYPHLSLRRPGLIALTVFVHAALLLAWLGARPPPAAPDTPRQAFQWIWLPARPAVRPPAAAHAVARPMATVAAAPAAAAPAHASAPASALASAPATPAAAVPAVATPTAPAAPLSSISGLPAAAPEPAPSLAERARKAAGAVDRALRKENRPYIVAPPDSPQIRLRKGIEAAADMAPNAWYQAPKIAELVNNTGDGVRRTRVVNGVGTYCINERPPTASIDTIETLGKQSPYLTCPEHETPASAQEWRTARD